MRSTIALPTKRWAAVSLLIVASNSAALAANFPIPESQAATAFSEQKHQCQADHAHLWNHSLCVPMMFVNPVTREAILNRSVPGATKDGAIYRITLPANLGLADTTLMFHGQHWSMALWPLPSDKIRREILLMHESYHSIQSAIGLSGNGGLGKNGNLDSRQGRIWLRTELAALRSALQTSGTARLQALHDALVFHSYRLSLWPHAGTEEHSLELNEGLAESTGIDAALSSSVNRIAAAVADIDRVTHGRSFVRSFPYATGPAYAELLDALKPRWRHEVTPSFSFAYAATIAYGISMPIPSQRHAMEAIARYNGKKIIAQENVRAKRIKARNAEFEMALVKGPILTLPFRHFSIFYNPQAVYQLPGYVSVYCTHTIDDSWGKLVVTDGLALISPHFNQVSVLLQERPVGSELIGQGWSATLKAGYQIVPVPHHKGSFILLKNETLVVEFRQ